MINTYEQQKQLVKQGLAKVSTNGNIDTFKYSRKVMFDYLWDTNPELLEVRGHSYDNQTGELVIAAPRKSFNCLENGHWKDVPLNTPVIAYKKYNGFMACVSKHKGELIISTTGSTKSDFVGYAKEYLDKQSLRWLDHNTTLLYEIVHPDDPHIVSEAPGAHYLGYRDKSDGHFEPYGKHEDIYMGTLKGILTIAEINRGEGFMVYDLHNDPHRLNPCKVKTPYYVGMKKLMRQGEKAVQSMYSDPKSYEFNHLPEMYWGIAQRLTTCYPQGVWSAALEQSRRVIIERLLATKG